MKIVLVNASIDDTLSYGVEDGRPRELHNVIGRDPPLGLCYLASVLRNNGYRDVEIIDTQITNLSLAETAGKIVDKDPDIIGVSLITFSFLHGAKVASKVKDNLDVPIIVGGFHVDLYPKEVMAHDFFDIGVVGEGEYTFLELVKALEKNKLNSEPLYKGIGDVKGIVYAEGNKIVKTKKREPINDLDSLPLPARDLLENEKYYLDYLPAPATSILTSRGCPFDCTFCSKTEWTDSWRTHSPEYVVDEMEHCIKKFGTKSFQFVDDTFTTDKERVLRISDLIDKRGIDVTISCLSRVDTVDSEVLESLKDVGLKYISFGVESGDPFILDRMNKSTTVKQIKKAFRLCERYDIKASAYFLVGHPKETSESVRNTMELIDEIDASWFKANLLSPYPGTELYQSLVREGRIGDYWKRMTKNLEPIKNPNISENFSKAELRDIQNRINLKPYLRPSYILDSIESSSPKQAYRAFKWVYHLLAKNIKSPNR